MALALGEQRDQHVGAGHFVAPGRLDMNRGALHDTLEAGGRLGIALTVGSKASQILVQEFRKIVSKLVNVDTAGLQDARGILIVKQAEQKMLKRCIFVLAFACERQRAV